MGTEFTLDALTSAGGQLCDEYYTRNNPFTKHELPPAAPDTPAPVVWCNPDFWNPMPLITHVVQQVRHCKGAKAFISFPEWTTSAAFRFLSSQFPCVKTYAPGTLLFDTPPPPSARNRERCPLPGIRWPVKVFRVDYDPELDSVSAALKRTTTTDDQYIFAVRVKRTQVRVGAGYRAKVLAPDEQQRYEDDPDKEHALLALGDTGATHTLIAKRTARQLGLGINDTARGRVVLGDNIATVPIVGTCEIPLNLSGYECVAHAQVVDTDWGDTQHIVLGDDWIRENRAMLGEADGRGPQITIAGPDGTGSHTIYAKSKPQAQQFEPNSISDSAAKFAQLIMGTRKGTLGIPWAAVNVSEKGVQFSDGDEVSFEQLMDADDYYSFSLRQQSRIKLHASKTQLPLAPPAPPVPPAPPPPRTKPAEPPPTHTPAGVPREHLEAWKHEFPTVFQPDLPDQPVNAEIRARPETVHTIPLLPNAKPVYRKAWRLSPAERAEIEKQVKYLLAKGLIQPSSSPWGAPILFAPKPDGTLRMCIDYRGLNAVTERDVFPIPRTDDMYSAIAGKTIFSSLDLLKGYWQIGIQPADRHLTAFTTPKGLYEYKVLPMGLANAPATFQRMMTNIFKDLIDAKKVLVYLDDILVMATTVKEHNEIMREVLKRLALNKLVVRFDKCKFGMNHIKFLGSIIGAGSICADPKKIQAVQDWPIPTTVTELRGFLGLANYFRRHIPNYAVIAAPLAALTGAKKKREVVMLSETELAAFKAVKAGLVNPPVLAIEDPALPYEVITDAAGLGIGAVLLQRDQEGNPRVIAYESKAFPSKQRAVITQFDAQGRPCNMRVPAMDAAALEDASGKQELAALMHALKIWRCYLEGAEFTVYVDHNPLVHLLQKRELNRWQVRILDTLATYPGLKIRHIPGRENIADGLSRIQHRLEAIRIPPPIEAGVTRTLEDATLSALAFHVNDVTLPRVRTGDFKPTLTKRERRQEQPNDQEARTPLANSFQNVTAFFNRIRTRSRSTTPPATASPAAEAATVAPTPDAAQALSASDGMQERKSRKRTRSKSPRRKAEAQEPQQAETPEPQQIIEAADDATPQGEAQRLLNEPGSAELATAFLQSCANGYVHDPDMKALLQKQTHGAKGWTLQNGLWYKDGALVLPRQDGIREACIERYHDPPGQGHPGATRTYQAVSRFYWWPQIRSDITAYVATCDSCQRMKHSHTRPAGLLQPLQIPTEKGRHWVCDFAVKLRQTPCNKDQILIMVDRKTRFTVLRACSPACGAAEAAQLFIEATNIFGGALSFVGDHDSRFTAAAFQDKLKIEGCANIGIATTDHHETVGLAERTIQQLKAILRHYVDATQTNWADVLGAAQNALNNGHCAALGTSPAYYMFGEHKDRPVHLPHPQESDGRRAWIHAEKVVSERLQKAQRSMLCAANAKRRDVTFHVGDEVLLSTRHPWFNAMDGVRKLIPAWAGPFRVTNVERNVNCTLQLPAEIKCHDTFHASLLKHYHPRTRRVAPPPATTVSDGKGAKHEEFNVEAIINHRIRKLRSGPIEEYRVAFEGYGPEHNMWLPLENLGKCGDKIAEYHARRKAGVGERALQGEITLQAIYAH